MRFLLLAFIAMPIIEMMVLFEVGATIGALNTILLVLLTAVVGVSLLKKQGLHTLMNANQTLNQGGVPLNEMGEGIMLAVAGALLLTPGFVTDTIGFLLLTPGVRQILLKRLVAALVASQQSGGFSASYHRYDSTAGEAKTQSSESTSNPMDPRHNQFRSPNIKSQEIEEADYEDIPRSKDP